MNSNLPKSSRLFALGAADANEQAALAALDQALDPRWLIFHSRKPLHGRADIDALIVAPHGVFVAELKYYRGTTIIGNGASWQRPADDGGRDEVIPNILQGQVQRQAQQLKAEFKDKAQLHHIWIEPVVIFTHASSTLTFTSSDAAQLAQSVFSLADAKARLEAFCAQNLAKRRSISRTDVDQIVAMLDQSVQLPAASLWPETVIRAPSPSRQAEQRLRERKRRTRQLLSVLTLSAALLITIGLYLLIRNLKAE
jgi:hypothetical protein